MTPAGLARELAVADDDLAANDGGHDRADRRAVRAVGRANGLNRIAILIPCHRIVNKNGDLGGYGGGLRRKQYLLNLEQVGMERHAGPAAAPNRGRSPGFARQEGVAGGAGR